MNKDKIIWIVIFIGMVILLLVAYGKISADKLTANIVSVFEYTLFNFFVSLAIGWIILPFDKLIEKLTEHSLKDIYVIEEELKFENFSLRVTITVFVIIEFFISMKYFI